MKCPTCQNTELVMTERQSVEIDYCPKCRGVWLDRGELDKIIARSDSVDEDIGEHRRHEDDDDHYRHGSRDRYHKRKGFWSELFD